MMMDVLLLLSMMSSLMSMLSLGAMSQGLLWSDARYVKAGLPARDNWFGNAISISGNRMAVGAEGERSCATGVNGNLADYSGCGGSGAVMVYDRDLVTGNWTFSAYLKASNTGNDDGFGWDVALDGDRLVVGAIREDSCATGVNGDQGNGCQNSGAAYVFEFNGTAWAQTAYIKASNVAGQDFFGDSVALDGDRIVVGAYAERSCGTGVDGNQTDFACNNAGAAYLFEFNGTAWAQTAYLKASNTEQGDRFGDDVDVFGDRIVVGAYGEGSCTGADQTNNGCNNAGAAYVFEFNGTGWAQTAYLKASNAGANDEFGRAVSLDGTRLVVAAREEDSCLGADPSTNSCGGSGAVFVFDLNATTGSWSETTMLKASNADNSDRFGHEIHLLGDRVAVGASREDSCGAGFNASQTDNGCLRAGAAYVFQLEGGTWSQVGYFKAIAPTETENVGIDVALGTDFLAVGGPREDSCSRTNPLNANCSDAGAVYVFAPPPLPPTTGTVLPATTATTGLASPVPPPPPSPPLSSPSPPSETPNDGAGDEGESAADGAPVGLIVGLAAAGVCVILVVLGAALYFRRRRRGSDSESGSASAVEMPVTNTPAAGAGTSAYAALSSKPPSKDEEEHYASLSSTAPSKDEAEIYTAFVASAQARDLTDDVEIATQIGKGNFGRVFRGDYDGRGVAIKQIMADAEEEAQQEFAQELGIMLKLNSARIIKLFGVCQLPEEEGGGMGLVMELAAKGSLDNHLQSEGDALGEAALLQISQHIAEGLAALHRASVVHRDLAARNVLVTSDGMCKLADFGLSRSLGEEETYTATSALPIRWTAPETLTRGKVTQASDLYSLAMTMIEIFDCGRAPFDGIDDNIEIIGLVTAGKRPPQPDMCPSAVFAVMQRLWAQEPKERGKARTAATELRELHAAAASANPDDTYQSVFAAVRGRYDKFGA